MPEIIRLNTVDSTNKYISENFSLLEDRVLVTAIKQTGGRGRRGKEWFSPPGVNLYASFLVKNLNFNIITGSWIGGLAALSALRESCSCGSNFWIKWPNDIYSHDKKLAGALCETISDSSNQIKGLIVGIGINVNMTDEQLALIDKPATSLLSESKAQTDINRLAQTLYESLCWFTNMAEADEGELFSEWKKDNRIIGRSVEVDISGRDLLAGKVVDIKRDGSLYVVDNTGEFHILYSGDVSVKKFDAKVQERFILLKAL